jgi:hypothetical protein
MPEGMIILPNKKIKISSKITGFNFDDLSSISILDSSGQVFSFYPKTNIPNLKYSSNRNFEGGIIKSDITKNNLEEQKSDVINLNNMGANVASSNNLELNKGLYPWFGLVTILILGGFSIIFIRRKNDYSDYMEKDIRAEDMIIIE